MGQLRLLGEPPASDDHAALANLAFPQAGHTGFVAAAGLAGGQTIIGGAAAGEALSLQSTAHAARGYVRVLDDLQLLSSLIRDPAGTQRIALATTSPHITLGDPTAYGAGSTLIWGRVGLGNYSPTIDNTAVLAIKGINDLPSAGCLIAHGLTTSVPPNEVWGLGGLCNGNQTGNLIAGLRFNAYCSIGSGMTMAALEAVRVGMMFNSYGSTTTLTSAAGIHVERPVSFIGAKRRANTQYGIYIEDQYSAAGYNTPTTVHGLKIDDISGGTNRYLLELGPATPNLRLLANAPPNAGLPTEGDSQLFLAWTENGALNLRRVRWRRYSSLDANDKVLIAA
jgi:hypothetical protein